MKAALGGGRKKRIGNVRWMIFLLTFPLAIRQPAKGEI
jgi:hypothetical protein